jgi:hypothetical protein
MLRATTLPWPFSTAIPWPSRLARVSDDHVAVPGTDDDAFAVADAVVSPHLVAVGLHEEAHVGVACEPVPLDRDGGRVIDVHAEVVALERVVQDAQMVRGEDADPVSVGPRVLVTGAAMDQAITKPKN